MDELTGLTVSEFLDRTAARSPTPGGGSVTGLVGALACSLARMVTAYSLGPKVTTENRATVERTVRDLHRCGQIIVALVTQDAVAYETMTRAAKARRTASGSTEAQAAYDEAVFAAVAVPMEIAAVSLHVLGLADNIKALVNPHLLSDLAVAARFAEAAVQSSAYTVSVNLDELSDADQREAIRRELQQTLKSAEDRLASVVAFVRGRLKTG